MQPSHGAVWQAHAKICFKWRTVNYMGGERVPHRLNIVAM
jgi:hypothetical protein